MAKKNTDKGVIVAFKENTSLQALAGVALAAILGQPAQAITEKAQDPRSPAQRLASLVTQSVFQQAKGTDRLSREAALVFAETVGALPAEALTAPKAQHTVRELAATAKDTARLQLGLR